MDPEPTTPWNDTQKILAIFMSVAFVLVIFVWMFYAPKSDQGATAVLNTLVGTLGGMETMIISFYFGSSRSARTAANTVNALVAQQHPTTPPTAPTG